MRLQKLGNSGLEVSPLVFGGNVFGWTVDEAESFRLLDAFVGAGFNFIDTADVYSKWAPGNHGGESETIMGNWLKSRGNRRKVVIATKVGIEMGPEREGFPRPTSCAPWKTLSRACKPIISICTNRTPTIRKRPLLKLWKPTRNS